MLDWLMKTHQDTAKELKATQQKMLRLEGGLAALEAAIKQARATGGGSVAAPAAPQEIPAIPFTGPNGQTMYIPCSLENPKPAPIQGVQTAVKVPHGPIQADEELRE